jgi:hypothetical protein
MEYGEGSAQVQFKQVDPDDDRKKIKIRVSVFFDGTLNNRTNIEQRLLAKFTTGRANPDAKDSDPLTAEEHQRAFELNEQLSKDKDYAKKVENSQETYKKYGKPGDDNSYEGYYSNVEKMNRYTDSSSDGFDRVLNVYVEGPGTVDLKGDEQPGFAFAMGKSGIPKRVKKGIELVLAKIKKAQSDKGPIVELIALDVFGFSRGAAGARKFIHDALFGGRFVFAGAAGDEVNYLESIRAQLEEEGYTILPPNKDHTTGVNVRFAGLYDTVSTYGLGVIADSDDNVSALNLNAIFHADETLHLASADEHRYHFSLTETRSAGDRGKQYFLPGVHSDIGGGYRDAQDEKLPILGSVKFFDNLILQACNPTPKEIEEDKARLIAAGWYREYSPGPDGKSSSEIEVENHDYYNSVEGQDPILVERRVTIVKRWQLSNAYSKIPLHIMTEEALNKGVPLLPDLEQYEAVPPNVVHGDKTLQDVLTEIQQYINSKGPYDSIKDDWLDNNQEWLRELRHQFFHFSARMAPGHDPRIEDGKRTRKHYKNG